jgi:hypothetical protein
MLTVVSRCTCVALVALVVPGRGVGPGVGVPLATFLTFAETSGRSRISRRRPSVP